MSDQWSSWFSQAVRAEAEDPFVDLLRRDLADGAKLVRVNVESANSVALPVYLLTLVRDGTLFQHRIPHSRGFERWSLEARVRMETAAEEEVRFAAMLFERWEALWHQWGQGTRRPLLIAHLRELQPPRTLRLVENQEAEDVKGEAWARLGQLHRVAAELARALVQTLGYEEEPARGILDYAMARVVERMLRGRDAPGLLK